MRRLVLLLVLFACKPGAPSAGDAGIALDPNDSKALLAEVDRLKDQLRDKPKTFEVLTALGNLYYENGRYLEAVDSFREALDLAKPFQAQADELAKTVKPAADLPVECRRAGPEYGLAEIAQASAKLDPPHHLRCLLAALESTQAARARRGNSLYLVGHPDGALAEHRKVLEKSPDYPESLFFVGAILLEQSGGDKAKLAEGKKFWERLLKVAPDHPRAALVKESLPNVEQIFKPQGGAMPSGHPPVGGAQAAAPGSGALPPGHPPLAGAEADGSLPEGHPPVGGAQGPMAHSGPTAEEVAQVQDAVQGTERTPELEKGLDGLVVEGEKALDEGKYQDARDALVRVMPMRPGDARVSAGLGGAMRGLGRLDMAERTLTAALRTDPRQPRALYELGKLRAQQGNKAAALEQFRSLQQADPKFASAHKVDTEIQSLSR